uniref:MARVEL domain-containing protein n=1 Tax=Parascaris univalens TaxID=6257 RepID=A0A915BS80_PARUN
MLDGRSKLACCTIRTAGIFVAFVEFLLCVLSLYGLTRNLHIFGPSYFLWFVLGVVSVIIILSVIVLLLWAIKTENARLLLPHLFVQVFIILFLIIVALVVFLLMLFGAYSGIRRLLGHDSYHMNEEATETLGFMIIATYLLVAVLEVFFLFIVYRLYQYLKEYLLISSRDPFSADNEVYTSNWQMPIKGAPYGRGSPDAGDIYPYGA